MSNLLNTIRSGRQPARADSNITLDEFLQFLNYGGSDYPIITQTLGGGKQQQILPTYSGLARGAFSRNGIVFACIVANMQLFSDVRFKFKPLRSYSQGDLFGTSDLSLLENPWPNATTRNLLMQMSFDSQLAGNAYFRREPAAAGADPRLRRLNPEWVTIVLGTADPDGTVGDIDTEIIGYAYRPYGQGAPQPLQLNEMVHYAPVPDAAFWFRGMSWLAPIVDEIRADNGMTDHRNKFMDNAATPNMVVKLNQDISPEAFERWVDLFEAGHKGSANAYRCLHPTTEVALWNGARCRADEINAGDLIVAWHDGGPVPGVVSAAERQSPSPIVTVTTERGRVIKTNEAHPFLTANGDWVAASELKPGDLLATGLGWGRPRMQDAFSADEAWMLGFLVGDGCFVGSQAVITASNDASLARLGGLAVLTKTGNPRGPYDYRVKGIMEKVRAAGLNGKRSWEKRVPAQVMTGGVEVVSAFVSGLIDADGHVSDPEVRSSAEVGLTSTSFEMLRDVQHLLASLGVNASISSPPSMRVGHVGGSSGKPRRRDAHRLSVFGNKQARRLAALLDLSHDEKAKRLASYARRDSKQDRSRTDRVASVRVGDPEVTIGIEVAGHHTHVTGGIVTHNTLYLAGGADASVVGSSLAQMDFKTVQAHGEVRICNAARIPPIIVGVSEGLDSATYCMPFDQSVWTPMARAGSGRFGAVMRFGRMALGGSSSVAWRGRDRPARTWSTPSGRRTGRSGRREIIRC